MTETNSQNNFGKKSAFCKGVFLYLAKAFPIGLLSTTKPSKPEKNQYVFHSVCLSHDGAVGVEVQIVVR